MFPRCSNTSPANPRRRRAAWWSSSSREKGSSYQRPSDHGHSIGKCYRCKSVAEPYPFAAVDSENQAPGRPGPLRPWSRADHVLSQRLENTYFDWMRNIKDWCISRQIWWGRPHPRVVLRRLRGDHREPHRRPGLLKMQKVKTSGGKRTCSTRGSPRPSGPSQRSMAREDRGACLLLSHVRPRHRPDIIFFWWRG